MFHHQTTFMDSALALQAGIGQMSPIAGKLLALFGEGGVLGPAQALLLDAGIRNKIVMKNLRKEEIATVFESRYHTMDQQVLKASSVNQRHNTPND